MRNALALTLALGLAGLGFAAGCVSSVPVASIECDQACSTSLDCVGALICYNGTCTPSGCRGCATACTYDIAPDMSCTFTSCR